MELSLKILKLSIFFLCFAIRAFSLDQVESAQQSKIDSLQQVIAKSPSAENYFVLGQIYLDRHQFENAKQQFIRCIQSDVTGPYRAQAHLQIGRIYYLSGDYSRASRELKKALRREPGLVEALNIQKAAENMAAAEKAFAENDLLKAESHYQVVIQVDAANQLARQRLNSITNRSLAQRFLKNAQNELLNQQYEKAAFYLEEAGKYYPEHPQLDTLKTQLALETKKADSVSHAKAGRGQQFGRSDTKLQVPGKNKKLLSVEKRESFSDSAHFSALGKRVPDTIRIDTAVTTAQKDGSSVSENEKSSLNIFFWIFIGFAAILVLLALKFIHKSKAKAQADKARHTPVISEDSASKVMEKGTGISVTGSSKLIGKYEIIKNLTEGGMGRVVKARHPHFKKPVVIKSILPELTHIPTLRQRLIREANVLFELDHPNIVRVIDLIEESMQVYIVMQFVDGMNLKEILETERALKPQKAIDFFMQLCEALQYLHERKIIHRDIKPQNIMVETGTQTIKLVDFGIIKPFDSEASQILTSESRIVGTPHYMSPEQLLNDEIDQRSDLFSLGIVFFEVLTGEHPFDNLGMSITRAILEKDAPMINDIQPVLSPAFVSLCEKMLARDRAKRYQSAAEIIHDLRAVRGYSG